MDNLNFVSGNAMNLNAAQEIENQANVIYGLFGKLETEDTRFQFWDQNKRTFINEHKEMFDTKNANFWQPEYFYNLYHFCEDASQNKLTYMYKKPNPDNVLTTKTESVPNDIWNLTIKTMVQEFTKTLRKVLFEIAMFPKLIERGEYQFQTWDAYLTYVIKNNEDAASRYAEAWSQADNELKKFPLGSEERRKKREERDKLKPSHHKNKIDVINKARQKLEQYVRQFLLIDRKGESIKNMAEDIGTIAARANPYYVNI